jgi:hypothetical protein
MAQFYRQGYLCYQLNVSGEPGLQSNNRGEVCTYMQILSEDGSVIKFKITKFIGNKVYTWQNSYSFSYVTKLIHNIFYMWKN